MAVALHRGGVEVVERWADEWRALCNQSVDDQPFYRPEWIAAHIKAFTPRAKVVLLTVTSEQKLLFVLPLLQEWAIFNGVPLRTLRGPANSHSCRFDAVRHSGSQGDAAVVAAWNYLHSLGGWDLLQFHEVPEGGTIAALVRSAGSSDVHIAEVPIRRNPYVSIPADPEGLQKFPINKRLRTQLRSVRRELAGKGKLQLQRFCDANPAVLGRFYELESSGWKGAEGSAIVCRPETRQFYDEVAKSAEGFGYLCVYTLEFDQQLLAAHFGLSYKGRYFSPKVAYAENSKQWAPGHLIVEEILRDCAGRNVHEYDITGPNDEWKSKWAAQARQQNTHFIFRRGIPGGAAYAIRFRLRPRVKKILGKRGPRQQQA